MRFHTNLPVRDIAATTRFYSVLFGASPVKEKHDYVKFLPQTCGLNISFHQSESGAGKFLDLHLGFEMPDQESLDEAYVRLKTAGMVSSEKDTSVCCYANQDKFWVTDPDGYSWEFYVLLEDTESKVDEKSKEHAKVKLACNLGGGCC